PITSQADPEPGPPSGREARSGHRPASSCRRRSCPPLRSTLPDGSSRRRREEPCGRFPRTRSPRARGRATPRRRAALPDRRSGTRPSLDETLAGLSFSGILEKRSRVKFVMREAGLGWIPYVIERLDHELHKYGSKIRDHKIEML